MYGLVRPLLDQSATVRCLTSCCQYRERRRAPGSRLALRRWPLTARYVVIEKRFCGPPDSGNGGYVSGLVAGILGQEAEVTLRRPPPLGRAMLVRRSADGGITLSDGHDVVAEAIPVGVQIEPPDPVGLSQAVEAARNYPGFARHPFPTCFVCGPERGDGDGLRIFPGAVPGREVFAAPWIPDRSLAGTDGLVRAEFLWAALDCPGAFANGFPASTMVLGRLAVRLLEVVRPEQQYIAVGWSQGAEGRKHFAGTAVFRADGQPVAVAGATWIRVVAAGS